MDNIRDRNAKGRQARGPGSTGTPGERHRSAKLTTDQVMEIRRLRANGMSTVELARRYGIKKHTVSQIANGQKWRHLPLVAKLPPQPTPMDAFLAGAAIEEWGAE